MTLPITPVTLDSRTAPRSATRRSTSLSSQVLDKAEKHRRRLHSASIRLKVKAFKAKHIVRLHAARSRAKLRGRKARLQTKAASIQQSVIRKL